MVPDLSWASGGSELGRISCSRVPRRWSACPRRRIPFFGNRRVCRCTNARMERSFMLEGLAGQAASTGSRTGCCCCICCKSAISVGGARWSGPLELPQCRWSSVVRSPRTASVPPDSSSTLSAGASRQLLYLHCLPVPPDSSSTLSAGASRQLLYTVSWSVCDSSTSSPDRQRQVCRAAGWGMREAGWKHE